MNKIIIAFLLLMTILIFGCSQVDQERREEPAQEPQDTSDLEDTSEIDEDLNNLEEDLGLDDLNELDESLNELEDLDY